MASSTQLPGNLERPDILICTRIGKGHSSTRTAVCTLNQRGYKPLLSTFTGLMRIILGIFHTVVHLQLALLERKNYGLHLRETQLGVKNILRGLIEMIPVAGNLVVYIIDQIRIIRFIKMDEARRDQQLIHHSIEIVILSAYGADIAQRPALEIQQVASTLSNTPTLKDLNNIITSPHKITFP